MILIFSYLGARMALSPLHKILTCSWYMTHCKRCAYSSRTDIASKRIQRRWGAFCNGWHFASGLTNTICDMTFLAWLNQSDVKCPEQKCQLKVFSWCIFSFGTAKWYDRSDINIQFKRKCVINIHSYVDFCWDIKISSIITSMSVHIVNVEVTIDYKASNMKFSIHQPSLPWHRSDLQYPL